MKRGIQVLALLAMAALGHAAQPILLDDQFELPPGFHIYRAADSELSGGSYDLCFDGQSRLLVGDGNAVRRLVDQDKDGRFDSFEVIATGLGPRGPQGLLVYGDWLYAVGGDGIQAFEGYRSNGPLAHRGRIGRPLRTGGDHDAHTILRGHDGYLYFVAGNGAGVSNRIHITEDTSPVLFEREASVFRISLDGQRWECLGSGGRNPPNLGMNYLGELFSFDSDMEWHVGLPWYRPVRLNHWAIGGDQGWQEVGAYAPYFIDCLPGILDAGRGSPTWGVFYEHNQFPERYRDSFLVCDYRWKRESDDRYATTGRLVAFTLQRRGAGWKAAIDVLARPKPGARDAAGRPIHFALVDAEVGPDGSLFLSDHNQGVWRVFYEPVIARDTHAASVLFTNSIHTAGPPISFQPPTVGTPLDRLLALPQPGSEWSRLAEESIRQAAGPVLEAELQKLALNPAEPVQRRLRAIRFLAPGFLELPLPFLQALSLDRNPEICGQAAWLLGLRGGSDAVVLLAAMLEDREPFIRRRAAEAFTRLSSPAANSELIKRLSDPVRLVRYVAMTALAHRPISEWFAAAATRSAPQARMRALVASLIRDEPPPEVTVRRLLGSLLREAALLPEDRLDLLRVVALFQTTIEADTELRESVAQYLLQNFPDRDQTIRWEQTRLLGEFSVGPSFPKLLGLLETERDPVTQFHIAQALARLEGGWSEAEEERLVGWFLGTQQGWFTEVATKGVQFPEFWSTVLSDFAAHHREALLKNLPRIDFAGPLGGVVLNLFAEATDAEAKLLALYRSDARPEARLKIIRALKKRPSPALGAFLRQECAIVTDALLRGALLQALAAQRAEPDNLPLILEGIRHPDPDVVVLCVNALVRYKPELSEALARTLLTQLAAHREAFASVQSALAALSGRHPPNVETRREGRPDRAARAAALEFWKNWYAERFGKPFEAGSVVLRPERSDEELFDLILAADFKAGLPERGATVYEEVQCHTCHGGGVAPGREGRLFGPDLAGVTRRLTRRELAEAIVYPSRQVADRFKGFEAQLDDATVLSGFVTELTADTVTLVDREQVHRLPRAKVRSLTPQNTSLMPERALNRLTDEELRHLLAFLDSMGAAPPDSTSAKGEGP